MTNQLHVVVSHPARQVNVYYRPRAAELMGADVVFLTGLYYRPDRLPYSLVRYLPAPRRARVEYELEKRRLSGLSPENIVSLLGPTLETVLRPMGKYNEWLAAHDWLASRWIRHYPKNGSPTILHCFQQTCVRTLRAARKKDMTRLLEITLPPLPSAPEFGDLPERESQNLREELRDADFVLAQSEYTVKAVQALNFPSDHIFRCHLGVDTDYFRPRVGPRAPGPLRVAFLGGASMRKGVHHLMKAWSEAPPPGAELVLAGNRTAGLHQLPQSIPACRILGRLPDDEFVRFLQSADLLVHPSLAEGGCNVVYEALACGVPTIVSTNATSAVRNGIEGIVYPVGDIESLKAALHRLCGDEALRRTMGEAARRRAQSLQWDSYSSNLAEIYRALGDYSRNGQYSGLKSVLDKGF